MFSLHFRVCRFKKSIRGLGHAGGAPLPTGGRGRARRSSPWPPAAGDARVALACGRSPPAEKTVFIKRQPKLYLVDVWYQMSTKTLSGWCLISNVNRNCIWLMFDINHQTSNFNLLRCRLLLRIIKSAARLNNAACNSGIGPQFYFVGFFGTGGNDWFILYCLLTQKLHTCSFSL